MVCLYLPTISDSGAGVVSATGTVAPVGAGANFAQIGRQLWLTKAREWYILPV